MGNQIDRGGDSLPTAKHKYIYALWMGIRQRCSDIKFKRYSDYGGRGITLYPQWNDYYDGYFKFKEYILNELGERPEGFTLDRIDNDGNYEPNNLRWATYSEQNNNRRDNISIEGRKEKMRGYQKKYCENNREKINERQRKKDNKEYAKQYYQKNKEKLLKYANQYYEKNK